MDATTISYDRDNGWSDPFPDWDGSQTLVVVFGAASFIDDPGPFGELRGAFPTSAMIGCSTAGEIHGTHIRDESLAVSVIRFEHTRVRFASATISHADDSVVAGKQIAADLLGTGLRAAFVLSEGLGVNGSELVKGFNDTLPADVIVTGGLAGDGDRFERTWVLDDGAPTDQRVVAVGLYGDRVRVGHGSKGGWDMFGPERLVTRSTGNVLYELDDRPALALYKDYLGELAGGLPATGLLFPLAIRTDDDERQLVRTILAVDEDTQSLTFAGDVPEGSHAQLMRANFDRLVGGAEAAANAAAIAGEGPVVCFAISCVGRRLVLGERTEEEVEAVLDVLPNGSSQVGFYSYGELSPYATGTCDLHNQTMTLTTIAEV